MNEYDHEPVRGLPAPLPPGETMLWQGSPDWKMLARRAFHVVPVGIYFMVLTVGAGFAQSPMDTARDSAIAVAQVLGLGVVAVAILGGLAWLSARTTVYTITTRRVVMRFGIALPISLNLPFRMIDAAGLRVNGDGSGDIPLRLRTGEKLAYLMLWPHARPWHFAPAEPMLRAVPDVQAAATVLARALALAAQQPAPAMHEAAGQGGTLPGQAAVAT